MMFRCSRFIYSFLVLSLFTFPAFAQRSVTVNSSGNNGNHAHNGSDGNRGNGYGKDGGRGSDGTPAGQSSAGTSAGHISVRLQTIGGKKVQMTGQITGPRQGQVNEAFDTDKINDVNLIAQGGWGGNGGAGGDGGPGGDGDRGRDATQYSWGTNGGNGGHGGDGANGSPGSNGGDGGNISIEVSEQDAQLLMLIGEVNTAGGNGGNPGRNGQGGRGGSGGSGGNSYSWSTQEYSGTDKDGNPTYRTEYHNNPGGYSGSNGSSGSDAYGNVNGGQSGTNGSFQYIVGGKSYSTRYDIKIIGFDIENENHDSIIEPGEIVTLSNIQIQNVGGMPTPKFAPLKIFLRSHGWVISLNQTLKFSQSLEPGQSATVEGTIQFKVANEGTKTVGKHLIDNDNVSPRVNQTGVDRDYHNSENAKGFTVQYPLQIEPIKVPKNLGPGQSAKVSFVIKNVSSKDYGKLSDLKRVIQSQLMINKDRTTTTQFQFVDAHGNLVDLKDGAVTGVDKLAPGTSITISGQIRIPTDAEVYQKIGLDANLGLGSREKGKGNDPRTIQTRQTQINISYIYQKTIASSVVLVTNHDTTPQELKAWFELFRMYGIKSDVWDLSFEGGLDFDSVTSSGETLADDLKGKLLIVLNNVSEDLRPAQLVNREQILNHALKNQTRVHFIGGQDTGLIEHLNDLLVPSISANSPLAKTAEELIKQIGAVYKKDGKKPAKSVRFLGQVMAEENDWFAINTIQEEQLMDYARNVEKALRMFLPEKRFILLYEFLPKTVEDGYFVNRIQLGKIKVYETLPDGESYVSGLEASDSEVHSPDWILGKRNQQALIGVFAPNEKLALLKRALEWKLPFDDQNIGFMLRQIRLALLGDIALEQKSLRKRPSTYLGVDLSKQDRYEALNRISDFIKTEPVKPNPAGNSVSKMYSSMVVQLLTDVYQLARSVYHDNYWFNNSLWDPTSTNRIVSEAAKTWVKGVLKATYEKDKAAELLDKMQDDVEKFSSKLNKTQRNAYLDNLTSPVSGLVRDSTLLSVPDDKIISTTELALIQKRLLDSEATRMGFMKNFQEEREARK